MRRRPAAPDQQLTAAFSSAAVAAADIIGSSASDSGTTATSAAAASGGSDISDHAFTAPDGTTFDPGSDGYDSVSPLFGDAPLLRIGGGMLDLGSGPYSLVSQDLEVYDGSGAGATDVGSVDTGINVSNVLGIESAQFTVSGAHGSSEAISSALSNAGFSGNDDVSQTDLASALTSIDLNGDDVGKDDVVHALANSDLTDDQLSDLGISTGLFGGFDPDNVADGVTFDPSQVASDLNSSDTLSDLPANESTYSLTNLTSGFMGDLLGGDIYNVYEATPNEDGTAAASISDTLVTPFGNFDVSTPFDAVADPNPGDAADGVDASSAGSASGASEHAFTISDGTTFDPGSDGYDSVSPTLFGVAPLLELGGGNVLGGLPNATQDLEVYDGGGAEATDVGSVDTHVTTANIVGIGITPRLVGPGADFDPDNVASDVTFDPSQVASDLESSDTLSELPANESTYSITNFTANAPELANLLGGDIYNVYEATPNTDGTAAASITDTLVTPFGNFDVSTPFDAIANLDPGDAADGVDASSAGSAGTASEHAFTISDGTTFDPGSDGYDTVSPLFGVAPLLQIGGGHLGTANAGENLSTQELEVYDGGGAGATDIGSVTTGVETSNVLGIESAQFTVNEAHGSAEAISSALSSDAFSGNDDVSQSDLASALSNGLSLTGDVKVGDIATALGYSDLTDEQLSDLGISSNGFGEYSFNPGDVADGITFDPSQVASDLNSSDIFSDLQTDSTYSITNLTSGVMGDLLGGNIYNVYEASPGDAADGSDATITDTLVTPWGNFDLSTPFNAIANLMPGDAAGGVDGSSAGGGGLFGGLGDLFGGSDSGDTDVMSAMFGDGDGGLGDLFGGGDGSDEAGGLFGDLGSSFVG